MVYRNSSVQTDSPGAGLDQCRCSQLQEAPLLLLERRISEKLASLKSRLIRQIRASAVAAEYSAKPVFDASVRGWQPGPQRFPDNNARAPDAKSLQLAINHAREGRLAKASSRAAAQVEMATDTRKANVNRQTDTVEASARVKRASRPRRQRPAYSTDSSPSKSFLETTPPPNLRLGTANINSGSVIALPPPLSPPQKVYDNEDYSGIRALRAAHAEQYSTSNARSGNLWAGFAVATTPPSD
jgi:hypothetical protein